MNEPIEFRIRFDGATPGLPEHRLSIGAFHSSLTKLLRALRVTADEVGNDRRRARTGKVGKLFDLQLTQIEDGCVNLMCKIVAEKTDEMSVDQHAKLQIETVTRFMAGLESEWRTSAGSDTVIGRYLKSLPEGVVTQEYEGTAGGVTIGKIALSNRIAAFPDHDEDFRRTAPRLRQVVGMISVIKFGAPGAKDGKIVLKSMEGPTYSCLAAPRLLDFAAQAYKGSVVAQVLVRHDLNRLISLRDAHSLFDRMSKDDRHKHLTDRWSQTLQRLGE
jgi:hypothetical protein